MIKLTNLLKLFTFFMFVFIFFLTVNNVHLTKAFAATSQYEKWNATSNGSYVMDNSNLTTPNTGVASTNLGLCYGCGNAYFGTAHYVVNYGNSYQYWGSQISGTTITSSSSATYFYYYNNPVSVVPTGTSVPRYYVDYVYSGNVYGWYAGYAIVVPSYYKGSTNYGTVSATSGSLPSNGRHTDGYWYVLIPNQAPVINISNPSNNQTLSDVAGYNTLSVSGTILDPDTGNILTVKQQVDSSTIQVIQTLTANGSNQPFSATFTSIPSLTEGSHALKLWVEDNAGGQSTIITKSFTVDRTPPSIPIVSLSNKTENKVVINWTTSTDVSGVVGYEIFRGSTSVGQTTTQNTFTITNLSAGNAYSFSVKAKDSVGNVITSLPLNVTTPDVTPPTVPTNLLASAKTDTSVNLSWIASTDNVAVTGYEVYKGSSLLGTTATNSYNVTGVTYNVYGPQPTYNYTVIAKDAAGNRSKASNVLIVTTNPDSPEFDDVAAGAIPILYETTYNAYISNITDVDFYKYTASADGIDKVTLNVPIDKNYDLFIYDSNLDIVDSANRGVGINEKVVFEVNKGAIFFIKVVGTNGGTIPYALKVSKSIINYQTDYQYDSNGNLKSKVVSSQVGAIPSLLFNGVDNKVTIGNLGARSTTGTIEYWMNPSDVQSYRNPLTTNGSNVGIRFEQNSNGDFYVVMGNDAGTFTLHKFFQSGSNPLLANHWYHISLVWDSSQNKVWGYVNGNLVFEEAQTLWNTNFTDFKIGTLSTASDRWFKGKMRDVRVWNTTRSQLQIQSGMNGLYPYEIGLIGNWPLNEGSGTIASDISGLGRNGTIIGASW